VTPGDFALRVLYWLPYYVVFVLAPALARLAVERAIGIRHEDFALPPPAGMAYEDAYRTLVSVGLYYPLFEEVVFRGAPLLLFGPPGLIVGSAVWVLMHPSWQLRYLSGYPLWKRVAFTLTSSTYYIMNAVFYGMMWLSGDGAVAVLYHSAHNTFLTLGDILREIDLPPLPLPWRKPRFIQPQATFVHRVDEGEPRRRRFVRRRRY